MRDPVETVLGMVEEGRITAEEAAALLAALEASDVPRGPTPGGSKEPEDGAPSRRSDPAAPRFVRVEVTEEGRPVVNIRLPASIGDVAMARLPGLSELDMTRIRQAIRDGRLGDLLRVSSEDGSGIRISVE